MRGDSLRDLYAKALALVGLSLLAAAGALFDYWPLSRELPHVTRLLNVDAPVPDFASIVVPVETAVRPSRRRPAPAVAAVPVAARTTAVTPVLTIAAGFPTALGTPVELLAPTLPVAYTVAPSPEPAPLTPPRPRPTDDPIESPDVVLNGAPTGEDGSAVSFVTGAIKKTGQTIARTGVRTGASIRDALVSFGGAFRRMF